MTDRMKDYVMKHFGVSKTALQLHEATLEAIAPLLTKYDAIKEFNQMKVVEAFQAEKVSDYHFTNSTGYGYGDIGRDTLDLVYARVFRAEKALVRPHFVSGTHAIAAALYGVLRPGDTLLGITGKPYDTIHGVIGIHQEEETSPGSLKDYGIHYKEVGLLDGCIDVDAVKKAIHEDPSIRLLHVQRSKGYDSRPSIAMEEMGVAIQSIKKEHPGILVFVDNCYGEFIEEREPIEVGADLLAGSLIKNIGGGLAPTGGYVVGKATLVDLAAYRLTVPGIGGEAGSTFGVMRSFYQGLFLAPQVSMEALKTVIYAAKLLELAGFEVSPKAEEPRTDIVQAITFHDEKKLIQFVKGIQFSSPIDSGAVCEPWAMPGYQDPVIMAAGAFIQGSSIEFSCDAPIRAPFTAYLQGGLVYDHGKIGVLSALSQIL